MDAELDLVENANDLIAVHNVVEETDQQPEPDRFAESDGGEEFNDESNDESGDLAASLLPAHLKEISPLAAWTVSTHKPGCGVGALCHPSTAHFWQSDGPQPHYLNIHFFKMVAIAYMRVFLDFEQDESYTPTKLQFLAGTGHHDLQDVCTMSFKEPKGWLEVDLSNAGGPNPFEDGEFDDDEPEAKRNKKRNRQPGRGPTLRCRLVQLRILENHQNGKDTHLRGLQLFAIDEAAVKVRRRKRISTKNTVEPQKSPKKRMASTALSDANGETLAPPQERLDEMEEAQVQLPKWYDDAPPHSRVGANSVPNQYSPTTGDGTAVTTGKTQGRERKKKRSNPLVGLREPDWMGEPSLR